MEPTPYQPPIYLNVKTDTQFLKKLNTWHALFGKCDTSEEYWAGQEMIDDLITWDQTQTSRKHSVPQPPEPAWGEENLVRLEVGGDMCADNYMATLRRLRSLRFLRVNITVYPGV